MPANAKDADLKLPLPSKNRFTELRQQITAREAGLRELVGDTFLVTHLIDENTHGLRLDQFLKQTYPHFSRAKLQKFIANGRIELRRERAFISPTNLRASAVVMMGDEVVVHSPRGVEPPVDFDFSVLYEDDALLVVNKPGNLPVHPSGRYLFHTLLMRLRQERADEIAGSGVDYHLVHRIDRETSGVLCLAKGSKAAAEMVRQFRERFVEKSYLALVEGLVQLDTVSIQYDLGSAVDSPIRLKMAAFETGTGELSARTDVVVKQRTPTQTLVQCFPKTGRQHQIRVHLAKIGHPIVGDKLYGRSDALFLQYLEDRSDVDAMPLASFETERQCLHSHTLTIDHPVTGQSMTFVAPMPETWSRILNA